MPRVKRSTKRTDRRKKILKRASGYFLTKSKLYQAAQEAVERGLMFAYTGRKQKKRQYRALWIVRINAACHATGIVGLATWMNTFGFGVRGARLSRIPELRNSRSPLRRLHGAHEATMFSHSELPPLERGITWSTVRLDREPQY